MGAIENDENKIKNVILANELKKYGLRLKFYEFLHPFSVIFYLRFRPLDVPSYAFGTKNEDFRSKSPYPIKLPRVAQVSSKLELPSF